MRCLQFFDMNEVQLRDFQKQKLPYDKSMKQYFIGHYNPRGNHFFAHHWSRSARGSGATRPGPNVKSARGLLMAALLFGVPAVQTSGAPPPEEGLVAWWSFDEGQGDIAKAFDYLSKRFFFNGIGEAACVRPRVS